MIDNSIPEEIIETLEHMPDHKVKVERIEVTEYRYQLVLDGDVGVMPNGHGDPFMLSADELRRLEGLLGIRLTGYFRGIPRSRQVMESEHG